MKNSHCNVCWTFLPQGSLWVQCMEPIELDTSCLWCLFFLTSHLSTAVLIFFSLVLICTWRWVGQIQFSDVCKSSRIRFWLKAVHQIRNVILCCLRVSLPKKRNREVRVENVCGPAGSVSGWLWNEDAGSWTLCHQSLMTFFGVSVRVWCYYLDVFHRLWLTC